MKLKLMVLFALFAAGIFASFALADDGKQAKHADGNCQEVHLSGTIAPQTLAVTVDKASAKALIPAGTQLSLSVGAAGQTVRVKAEACATGTGSSLVLTVKRVELRPAKADTGQTSTDKQHGDKDHEGDTTTVGTTTAAATTTTTTTP